MGKKTKFREKMEQHLEMFLNDNSQCERYLNTSGTIADWTQEIISDCEELGIEEEALDYIKNNPDLDILEFGDYISTFFPALEIVDDDADVYDED